jgi:hypothetical protein
MVEKTVFRTRVIAFEKGVRKLSYGGKCGNGRNTFGKNDQFLPVRIAPNVAGLFAMIR